MLRLSDWRDLATAVQRCRLLLDLDADPIAVDGLLGTDPLLAPFVATAPGRRVPGHVDGAELAARAVLGQQVSVAAARTAAARLVQRLGERLPVADGSLTHLFPEPAAIAEAADDALPMPTSRRRALRALSAALAAGDIVIDSGADRHELSASLRALPGIGPWTAAYTVLRGTGDPDVFLEGDLGVRRALERLGQPADPRSAARRAERWRPWRAYALQHLWGSLSLPPTFGRGCSPAANPGTA
jgi:AraC family transcriptional regulator of adaptative response / DNA-3-methyladenine glycosylase II